MSLVSSVPSDRTPPVSSPSSKPRPQTSLFDSLSSRFASLNLGNRISTALSSASKTGSSLFASLNLGTRISAAVASATETGSFLVKGTGNLLYKSGENVYALAGKVSPFTWTNELFHDVYAKPNHDSAASATYVRRPSVLFSTAYTLRAAWHAGLFGVEFASKIPKNVLAYLDQADQTIRTSATYHVMRTSATHDESTYDESTYDEDQTNLHSHPVSWQGFQPRVSASSKSDSEFDSMIRDLNQARRYFPLILKPAYFESLSKNIFLDTTAKALYFVSAKTQQVAFYSFEFLSFSALALASGVFGQDPVHQLARDFDLSNYFGWINKGICDGRNNRAYSELSRAWSQLPTIRKIFDDSCNFVKSCYYPDYIVVPAGAGIHQGSGRSMAGLSSQSAHTSTASRADLGTLPLIKPRPSSGNQF